MLSNHNVIESAGSSGYTIANSLRLRASASAMLTRTPSVNGTSSKGTLSTWVKYSGTGIYGLMGCRVDASNFFMLGMSGNQIGLWMQTSGTWRAIVFTNGVWRDPSAWYHVVIHYDTAGSTGSGTYLKVYVNGELQTLSVNVAPNGSPFTGMNSTANQMQIGFGYSAVYFDGYLANYYWFDGVEKQASDFGQYNSDGVWTPKAYAGSWTGANSFFLPFNDGSNLTNLCLDRSGNGNNWTATNVSLTAGATYDWMVDTPSVNYCVVDPIYPSANSISNANLTITYSVATVAYLQACTFSFDTGEYVFEASLASFSVGSAGNNLMNVGFWSRGSNQTQIEYGWFTDGSIMRHSFRWLLNGVQQTRVNIDTTAFTSTDILALRFDSVAGVATAYKNGVQVAQITSITNSGAWTPIIRRDGASNAATWHLNFGQRPMSYSYGSAKALNTANLPAVTVLNGRKNFDVLLHTGGASASQTLTGLQFQPDIAWFKSRSSILNHALFDSVRGANQWLGSNLTNSETTWSGQSFQSTGFTVDRTASSETNSNGVTYADWFWKAGGAAVTNTAGSISSQVSANTTAGISIVGWTGTGAAATIGHGLGTVPRMMIVKTRSRVAATSWAVYHASIGNTGALLLDTTGATSVSSGYWNNTTPTSSVFSVLNAFNTNASAETYIGYVFAEVAGFSRFGSYTGNGSTDGPFVFCGFRPRFVMIKHYSGSISAQSNAYWMIVDTARSVNNSVDLRLHANTSDAEYTNAGILDITANGFKLRWANADVANYSGGNYIFAAFAENPTGGSNVAPATAR